MNDLRSVLADVAVTLRSRDCGWDLMGGLAVSTYVEPRFTRDVDLAVAVADDGEAERLVHSLQTSGYRMTMVMEQEDRDRLAMVRLVPPGGSASGVVVDLMFASSGIEPEICRDAVMLEVFSGVTVPVCRPGHLIALKVLARDDRRRPQDLLDPCALFAQLEPAEHERARAALALIQARGYDRSRELVEELDRLLAAA